MGEYEPDDSRDVTLKPNNVPGEPAPTGPREDEARKQAQTDKGQPGKTQPHQQQQAQSQSQGGMSQSMGGMSQSIGKPAPNTVTDVDKEEQAHAPGASRVQADTFEEKDVQVVDPAPWGAEATPPSTPDPNRESDTGIGEASYDSYADTLSDQAGGGDDARRRQAAEQGDAGDVPAPADSDEDAEATEQDSAARGYGDSGEDRLAILRDGKS
ncbi:hypothetical protein PK98_14055 [Croceibacterium mercuriale]|uniref:Uncharacterized protein n=1 Tax=Croceibacterium mercuriale TaxID=1572751 RepID=A0A0B2BY79_9SPHN|nr:hypothetical protein [Croceibacterium mercuriale]KHL24967.1 hypothetical protein PK98_14055 [Croceibacterium mercuriale]